MRRDVDRRTPECLGVLVSRAPIDQARGVDEGSRRRSGWPPTRLRRRRSRQVSAERRPGLITDAGLGRRAVVAGAVPNAVRTRRRSARPSHSQPRPIARRSDRRSRRSRSRAWIPQSSGRSRGRARRQPRTERRYRRWLGGLLKRVREELRSRHRGVHRCVAVPEARSGGRLCARVRGPLGRRARRVGAGTEWDQLVVRRQPVTEAHDLRFLAVCLVALPGGSIVRFHGFAAPFSVRALLIATSGSGSITI